MTILRKPVTDMGYQYFDWNVSAGDSGGRIPTELVVQRVTSGIAGKQIAVVLQHDIYDYSIDGVEQIILWGLENGYAFLPLTPDSPPCRYN